MVIVERSCPVSHGVSANLTVRLTFTRITQRTWIWTGACTHHDYWHRIFMIFVCRYLATNFSRILEIMTDIKESGNVYYKRGDHTAATRKYRKCCKYIKLLRDTMGQTDDDEEKL